MMGTRFFRLVAVVALVSGCRTVAPPMVRFAPPGTDVAALRNAYQLSDAERLALTPENLRALTQEQVDQIYARLASGALPDGAFRGDLFFPRGRNGRARIRDLADPSPGLLAHVAALRAERLGRVLWKGKVFFRSERVVRNRIDDRLLLRPIIRDSDTIPKLTFDGETTWLLFPARLSCGESRFDPTRPSIVVDYSEAPNLEGYRPVPDRLAGPDALNIRDEVRIIRPGFYLGRAYFGTRFALNFTLVDPAGSAGAADAKLVQASCDDAGASEKLEMRR
jgi:hypothetical protein